ncbi:MAG: nucleotidyltransferase domain-containing protein, partial [Polyangiales bacterium]
MASINSEGDSETRKAHGATSAPSIGPASIAPNLTQVMREYLQRYRAEETTRLERNEPAMSVGRSRTRAMDGLLSALLPAAKATLSRGTKTGRGWVECSIAAVGSYGRGVLAPGSDLDVRVVVDRKPESAEQVAEAILYPLWDAGLSIGHQIIDADDAITLARDDLATATSLLDLRPVAGDRARIDALSLRAFSGFFSAQLASFVERLRDERDRRHERFGGSLYLLEPDVKLGAGGLRDLDLARWAARARYRVRELDELVKLGVMVPREADELAVAQSFLWDVRARLHLRHGRRSDRITFDAQEEIGRIFGRALGIAESEPTALAAEAFMQRYYGHARTVSRLVDRVLDLCDPPRKTPSRWLAPPEGPIASGIKSFDGHATFDQPAQLASDPALALRLYASALRKELPVYPYARDAVTRACAEHDFGDALRKSPEAAQLFVECLTTAAERCVRLPGKSVPKSGSI